jgi:hypothetical protein
MRAEMKQPYHFTIDFKSLLVAYATLDLVFTVGYIIGRYDLLFESEMNPIYPPAHWYAYPFLLLVACIATRISRKWSYLLAVVLCLWLIKKIIMDWAMIAQGQGSPMLSWAMINYWWTYAALFRWNIVRLPIAMVVVIYSISQFISTRVHQEKPS